MRPSHLVVDSLQASLFVVDRVEPADHFRTAGAGLDLTRQLCRKTSRRSPVALRIPLLPVPTHGLNGRTYVRLASIGQAAVRPSTVARQSPPRTTPWTCATPPNTALRRVGCPVSRMPEVDLHRYQLPDQEQSGSSATGSSPSAWRTASGSARRWWSLSAASRNGWSQPVPRKLKAMVTLLVYYLHTRCVVSGFKQQAGTCQISSATAHEKRYHTRSTQAVPSPIRRGTGARS
jgi:hypothetical protein